MNGAHVLFKPQPVHAVPMPREVREKLAALRAEFAQRAHELIRSAPSVFLPSSAR